MASEPTKAGPLVPGEREVVLEVHVRLSGAGSDEDTANLLRACAMTGTSMTPHGEQIEVLEVVPRGQ